MGLQVRGRAGVDRSGGVILTLVALVAALLVPLTVGAPPAAALASTVSLTTVRDMAWTADGRILVAGDDRVVVYDAAGSILTVVPDVFGAADIDVRDGHAYVVQPTAGAVADIDLSTYSRTDITIGTTVLAGGIAVLPDAIWFLTTSQRIARFSRTTSAVTLPSSVTSPMGRIERVPGDDSRVVTAPYSSGQVVVMSNTTPYAAISTASQVPNTTALAPTTRGTVVVSAGNGIRELDLDDMSWATDVRSSPDSTTTTQATWSAGGGGVVAWGGGQKIFVGDDATSTQSHILTQSEYSNGCVRSVSLDTTATRLAYVVTPNCTSGVTRLVVEPLAPSVSTVVPGSGVRGVPAEVTITGSGLGEPTSVMLGGTTVVPSSVSPTRLVLPFPTNLAVGTYNLVITTAFGTATRTFHVTDDVGALLQGTVRRGSTAVAGALVTLEGSAIPVPRTATTGATGAYSFPALPYGTDYRLTISDPVPPASSQVIAPITMRPNDPTTVDVGLVSRTASGSIVASATLPSTTPADVVLDPSSGRTFVAVPDELVVVANDGAISHRLLAHPGVSALAESSGSIYALTSGGTRLTRISASTLATTGSWALPASTTATGLVVAGGRVWMFASASPIGSAFVSLDPATGVFSTSSASSSSTRLRPVAGDPNLVLSNEGSNSLRVLDVGSGAPVTAAYRSSVGSLSAHADATYNRVWLPNGEELRLSDLTNTGVTYPVSSSPSYGVTGVTARGGLIVTGSNIALRGTPRITHVLSGTSPSLRPVVDPTGSRVVAVVSSTVVTHSLAPSLSGPGTTYAEPQTLTVTGSGLGAATSARVDGSPVTLGAKAAGTLGLELPSLSPGAHTIDVTTPWGTTAPLAVTAVTRTPTPTITSVAPSSLPTAGGTLTITGSAFTGTTEVKIGSVAATSFTVVDSSTLTATFAPRAVASATLSVTTAGGGSSVGGPLVPFVAPQPVVSGLSPSAGPAAGGTVVTVTGSGFQFATGVKFGATSGSAVTVVSDTELRVTSPAGPTGSVDVKVTTAGGTSLNAPGAVFTYQLATPKVTGVSPSSGPSGGGTLVTLTGTDFTTVQRVQFGQVEATYVVADATRIVAVAPPGSGVVNVRVTTTAGSSTSTTTNRFTYVAPDPGSVRGVVRNSAGPLAGMAVALSRPDRFEMITYVLSGPDGSFEIPAVPPGEYRVLTLDPASLFGATTYHLLELYDDGGSLLDDVAAATPVVVSEGAPTVLDPIVLAHSNPGTISGVVRDNAGHELSGMEVVVSPAGAFDSSVSVLTGADGRFTASGLAPGSYRIVTLDPAASGGAASHYVTEVYKDAGGLSSFGSSTQVPLAAGGSVELDPITLAHTTPGSLTATVTSTTGVRLQNMVVFVANADGEGFGGANVTAANGTVTVGNLPPGEYRVGIFDARAFFGVPPLWATEFYDDAANFETSDVVVVTAGAATSLGTVTLAPFAP